MREAFLRLAHAKGFWGYYLPLDVTLSFSAVYEIIEWLTAAVINPAAGIDFLEVQGDIWDAQKDMLAAGIGATISMLVVAAANFYYDKHFQRKLKDSFKISDAELPKGDKKLKKIIDTVGEALSGKSRVSKSGG